MTLSATVVDWGKLLDVVWSAAAAGVGVTIIFALAVFGATRSSDMRRAERTGAAGAFALLGLLGFAATAASVVFAITLITQK
jgi:hypothetical protein